MQKFSFFDFFPAPKFLEMPAPGLSLSDNAVRFVEFGHDHRGTIVKKNDELRFPSQLIFGGTIQNQDELVRILKEFREKNDLHYIRASLPEERAYLFSTIVPDVSSDDIRTSIEFTIEENVPLSVSEAVFDYTVVGPVNLDGKQGLKVTVSVLPQQVVMEYLTIFRNAGFEPLHFEIESQAIAKAIIPKNDERVVLIMNMNIGKVGLYISDQSAIAFTSTIPVGLFPSSDAKKGPVADATFSVPKDLIDETKKVFLYWQTQADRKGSEFRAIEKIVLVGEEASRKGIASGLSEEFSVPVEVANVWQNIFSLTDYIPQISKKDSLTYASAIGLALLHRK